MLLIMQKIRTTTQLLLFILLISWGGYSQQNWRMVNDDGTTNTNINRGSKTTLGYYFATPPDYQLTPKKFKVNFWSIRHGPLILLECL